MDASEDRVLTVLRRFGLPTIAKATSRVNTWRKWKNDLTSPEGNDDETWHARFVWHRTLAALELTLNLCQEVEDVIARQVATENFTTRAMDLNRLNGSRKTLRGKGIDNSHLE